MRRLAATFIFLVSFFAHLCSQTTDNSQAQKTILIRCDDLGMCHAVNIAAVQLLETRLPVSFSVMFACPWYPEAVEILKRFPHASVGVHLTLNSEWKNYRWGPITGTSTVPSLVDSQGNFFPSRSALFANKPQLKEIELELRAQIERAMKSGVKIDYLDYHMGAAVQTLETRQIVEALAKEYGLAISRYFGEVDAVGIYATDPINKVDSLVTKLSEVPAGQINLFVFHIGLQTPEMDALEDLNASGLKYMSKHRESELRSLLSQPVREILKRRDIRLLTYRDLIDSIGLSNMKRPSLND